MLEFKEIERLSLELNKEINIPGMSELVEGAFFSSVLTRINQMAEDGLPQPAIVDALNTEIDLPDMTEEEEKDGVFSKIVEKYFDAD